MMAVITIEPVFSPQPHHALIALRDATNAERLCLAPKIIELVILMGLCHAYHETDEMEEDSQYESHIDFEEFDAVSS